MHAASIVKYYKQNTKSPISPENCTLVFYSFSHLNVEEKEQKWEVWQEVLRKSSILHQAARPDEFLTDGYKTEEEELKMFSCSGNIHSGPFSRGSNRLSSLSLLRFPSVFYHFTAAILPTPNTNVWSYRPGCPLVTFRDFHCECLPHLLTVIAMVA